VGQPDVLGGTRYQGGGLKDLLPRLDWPRHKLALAAGFALLVLVQGFLQIKATDAGRPYEGWDEIATYNSAHVVSGPVAERTYRYGTLDTFMQWTAIVGYQYFDPIGRSHPHIRYGNQAPPSWNDPHAIFGGKTWDGADYNYFRGSDDRQPIFISRQIHFIFVYAVLMVLGLSVVAALERGAAFVLAPLLLLIAAPEMQYQATQSLPNATNALLVFGTVFFAMLYAHRQRRWDLTLSLALLALGMNFKPDIVVAAGAPGLALVLVWLRCGWRVVFRDAIPGILSGLAIILATDPNMLTDPVMNVRIKYHIFVNATGGGNDYSYIHVNWQNFCNFLDSVFLWRGLGGVAGPVLAALGISAAFLVAAWQRTGAALIAPIGAAVAGIAWAAIILKAPGASDRYFLNGLAAFLATMSMALFLLAAAPGWRRIAQGGAILVAVICFGHLIAQDRNSLAIASASVATSGFDPAHHRTLASLDAVKLAQAPGFRGKVLVDQHSYIDLRPFRLHGIDAQYVNMDTLSGVIASLDRAQENLVVFARGTVATHGNSWRPWMGDWSPEMRSRYQSYQAQLLALPVVKHYGGQPHEVLSTAPIEPNTETFVSAMSRR
jgi:hypothetical protein